MPWSWSSSAHDPRQRNYTCYQTTHNLSIRTYDYWHRLSERRLSSEYSVLILFRIRILYQSLRKLWRSEIFSLFLNLFVSYALLLQETSWMDSRPHRPPASITRCLLQKLWHFTDEHPASEPGSARSLKAALGGIYCGADRAHSLYAPRLPACLQRVVKWTQSVSNSKACAAVKESKVTKR